ncbi:hypothetical protein [Pseudomonas canadensis]|uniref:hypothetical protein n=1 Tax=Pseudomonas canadensis TaxID=915099 RepID=UPI003B9FF171
MLKPIKYSNWKRALVACQRMMKTFALWLCNPAVNSHSIAEAELIKVLGSRIEGQWLWHFLGRKDSKKPLLIHASRLADLNIADKTNLEKWIVETSDIGGYFTLVPAVHLLPVARPLPVDEDWTALQKLMEAFYIKGLRDGLPYSANGTITEDRNQQVTYKDFKSDFLQLHKIDSDPDAREVCVVCASELGKAHVDHWVGKAEFPLLSVCAHNLIPMCDDCNEAPNKGTGKVHTGGSFQEWFHPYQRPPAGKFGMKLHPADLEIELQSIDPSDAPRVANLNTLFNLTTRWSKEARAEYRKVQRSLERRQVEKKAVLTAQEIDKALLDLAKNLCEAEPNYEVHTALYQVICAPARLIAWQTELKNDFDEKVASGLV